MLGKDKEGQVSLLKDVMMFKGEELMAVQW